MDRTSKAELTNMIMIHNPETDEAVVINRRLSWCGVSFPGGHVEPGESFYDSAVREAYEETGLKVYNLHFCGVIHWHNTATREKYLVFAYRTSDYDGELLSGTDEGDVKWMSLDELSHTLSENRIADYLPLFLNPQYNEAYAEYTDIDPCSVIYK